MISQFTEAANLARTPVTRTSFGVSGLVQPVSWSLHPSRWLHQAVCWKVGGGVNLPSRIFLLGPSITNNLSLAKLSNQFSGLMDLRRWSQAVFRSCEGVVFLKSANLYFLSLGRKTISFQKYFSQGNHHKTVHLCWLKYFSPFQIPYCSFHVYCFLYASLIASFWGLVRYFDTKKGRCETLYYSASYFDLKLHAPQWKKTIQIQHWKKKRMWEDE